MAFHAATCPQCKGSLQLPDDRDIVKCMYCASDIVVREALRVTGPSAETLMNLADQAMDARNAAEAFQLYSRVLELDPKNVMALLGKGAAAGWDSTLKNMRFMEMGTYLNAAVEATPPEMKTKIRQLACMHIKTVSTALWTMACEHLEKYAALDDTWSEWCDRGLIFLRVNELAHNYDPDDKVALKNIITVSRNMLQGIAYTTHRGNPSTRQLTQEQQTPFKEAMDRAVFKLKKLDPSFEPPPVKKASAGGCLVLLALLLGAATALAAGM